MWAERYPFQSTVSLYICVCLGTGTISLKLYHFVQSFLDYNSRSTHVLDPSFQFSKAKGSFEMASSEEAAKPGEGNLTSSYILKSQHTTREVLAIQNVTTLPELFKWQAQRRCDATLFSF